MTRVHVVGAGIGGMTAAHELAERGFEVHVHEEQDQVGGKAVSQPMTVGGATADCLGEHGFRFFPWFYRHLPDTLRRIPAASGNGSVHDWLREVRVGGIALDGRMHEVVREPGALDILRALKTFFAGMQMRPSDVVKYGFHLARFWTASEERKLARFEHQSWSRFIWADRHGFYTPRFARLVKEIPLMLVAMRAEQGSARTIGHAAVQLLVNIDPQTNDLADAVLAAPTSLSWMQPWKAQLERLGARFHFGRRLVGMTLNAESDRIVELVFSDGTRVDVSDAHVVCGIPIEGMRPLLSQIEHADPALRTLRELIDDTPPPVGNMVGAQYALAQDIPITRGHVAFAHTDWAITAVSQPQFWSEVQPTLADYFRIPGLRGVISAIASDWDTPVDDRGSAVHGKAARDCSEAEILDEIWRQMRKAIGGDPFPDGTVGKPWLAAQLDRNVSLQPFSNRSPLLVHPPGSYLRRPESRVAGIGNLALASDYVRTRTDIATMESANEAGRWAALAVLQRCGSTDSPAFFEHKLGFEWPRWFDRLLWALSRPHFYEIESSEQLVAPAVPHLVGLTRQLDTRDSTLSGNDVDRALLLFSNANRAFPMLRELRSEWSEELFVRVQSQLVEGLEEDDGRDRR